MVCQKISEEFIIQRTEAFSKRFSRLLKIEPPIEIIIKFRNGMRQSYATADTKDNIITFSRDFINNGASVASIDLLIGHEVAHIYADRPNGRLNSRLKPHHNYWKNLMIRAGLPPLITYNEDELKPYIVSINYNWTNLSAKKLADWRTILISFDKNKIKKI